MKSTPTRRWDHETILVAQIAICISVLSFFYYLSRGEILLYGDVFGHINIARRIFDSRTPGLLQLGTVWLPLAHLLMLPFVISDRMWQTGIGGSIPSIFAYIFAVVGIFRLTKTALSRSMEPDAPARRAAWIATAIFAANPNLIYMQATAMTESLYLAFSIWAVVHFVEFVKFRNTEHSSSERSLMNCGFCIIASCLTRYDGWFLAVAISLAVLVVFVRSNSGLRFPRRSLLQFILLAALAPALWLGYNAIVYRNPLEFANGPYSAKALARKDAAAGTAPYPGAGSMPVASIFFLKSAQLNLAEGDWGRLWLALAFAGVVSLFIKHRRFWPLLLLWVPLPFYALSITYGGVPIYLPVWWPHGYYNVRYGLELLPAFAVFAALAVFQLLELTSNRRAQIAIIFISLAAIAAGYAGVWRAQPICFREALINSHTRTPLEGALGDNLKMLPPNSTLLMSLGDHVGALQRAGIPLRRTINENDAKPWRKPSDPPDLWGSALANPALYADYVVASEGDAVATRANHQQLTSLIVIHTEGEPPITIYSTPRARASHKQ